MVITEIMNVVLPVFLLLGVGYVVGKSLKINSKSVSDLCLYVFSPALFFHSVTTSSLNLGDLGKILLFSFSLFLLYVLLIEGLSFIFKWNLTYKNTLMLASGFPNSGNYGLPIILFAFGDAGLSVAVIYVVMQSLLMNSAGIFYASNHGSVSKKEVFLNIFKMPGFIAVFIGIMLKVFNVPLPVIIEHSAGLLGQAAVPTLLTLLGITLASVQLKNVVKFLGIATFLKLIGYPAIAFLLLGLFYPWGSPEASILLICAATPTAATTTLLAIKFKMNSDMVSSAMFVSTMGSVVTIPLLLFFII
ncbi:AEC family transporter [Planococcus sp. YIM B11945]|uniref:AEC family transporter n=1 Tax=Planococcus sp. YIM B11945 TaxID=3435410 RepID=UPI003D7CBF75